MDQFLLDVSNLACERSDKQIFSNFNLKLKPGEIVHLRAANGIGKSTVLKIFCNIIPKSNGNIILDKNKILYIGHELALTPELTVYENLEFLLQVNDNSLKFQENKLNQALNYFNLLKLRAEYTYKLSKGQQQKLSLARLYLTSRKIWLLDEPYSALDNQGIELLNTLFIQHVQNSGAIILASHLNLALDYEYTTYDM